MPEWIYDFPLRLNINISAIDEAIRHLSIRLSSFFDAIKNTLNFIIVAVNSFLDFIPWWVIIALVFFVTYRATRKIHTSVIYSFLIFLVGLLGFWEKMNETLAIVITSVFFSVIFGFVIGVLISGNDKANDITRPLWDTMQTMPVFVYLIPAILFFGLGKAPAVIATTIYAVVPMIRLTNHGVRQVDEEIVEAAKAFGSTPVQALMKVKIPQALPTIMTGINQTIMMAMAMVVTCSMIGASGLGMEVLISVNRIEMGRGVLAGISVVIIAVLLDRITGGFKRVR